MIIRGGGDGFELALGSVVWTDDREPGGCEQTRFTGNQFSNGLKIRDRKIKYRVNSYVRWDNNKRKKVIRKTAGLSTAQNTSECARASNTGVRVCVYVRARVCVCVWLLVSPMNVRGAWHEKVLSGARRRRTLITRARKNGTARVSPYQWLSMTSRVHKLIIYTPRRCYYYYYCRCAVSFTRFSLIVFSLDGFSVCCGLTCTSAFAVVAHCDLWVTTKQCVRDDNTVLTFSIFHRFAPLAL